MQVFRLMNLPDRVIAFDELPDDLLIGIEMCRADGFPRHWKQWMGKKKKLTNIPPEKDQFSGQVRRFDPIVEEDCFFYLIDWNVQPIVEKWQAICDYVRQHVDKETRLMEKITDMAVPLAPNKSDGITLEPEEVPVIKIIKSVSLLDKNGEEKVVEKNKEDGPELRCDVEGCSASYGGRWAKNGLRMHKMKAHKEKVEVAA